MDHVVDLRACRTAWSCLPRTNASIRQYEDRDVDAVTGAIPVAESSHMFTMIIGYNLLEVGWVSWVSLVLDTVMYL